MQQYGATIALIDRMTRPLQAISNSMNAMINTMVEVQDTGATAFDDKHLRTMQQSAQELGASVLQLENDMASATNQQVQMNNRMNQGATSASGLERQLSRLLTTYLSFRGVRALIGLSDELQNIQTRLDMVGVSLNEVTASARRSRADLLQTGDVIAKMGAQAGHAFANKNELIAFTETLNKTFVIAGNDPQAIESVVYNLTQAMSLGVLRGQDLNAVLSNTPQIAQAIADYLEVDISKIRELAEAGVLTSDVVKNAILATAEDVNQAFENMPYTWGQVWRQMQTVLITAFEPLLQVIGAGAQWVEENWETIEPVFWGVAAAVGAYVLVSQASALWTSINTVGTLAYNVALIAKSMALGLVALATGNATLMQQALNTAMLASPIGVIMLGITALIAWLYRWVKAIGGVQVAWATAKSNILFAWDMIKWGFMKGVYSVIDLLGKMQLRFQTIGVTIQNYMGDMRVGVLNILQSMVNGAIDIINKFIGVLNKIPGVSINTIEHMTFATTAAAQNEANKQARTSALTEAQAELDANIAERDQKLAQMRTDAYQNKQIREAEIADMRANSMAGDSAMNVDVAGTDELTAGVTDTAGNARRIADSMDIATDVIEYMRDLAERETINRFTTAEINNTYSFGDTHVSNDMDLDGIVDHITRETSDALSVMAEGANFDV